jgi:DNA-binding NarL/FixJ family response regulator
MRTETPALLLILAEAAIHVGRPEAALEAVRLAEAGADAAWYARDAERMRDVARWLRTRARCQRSADAAQALRDARSDGGIVSQRVVRAAVLADGAWYALLAGDARESESLAERARREIERAAPVDAYDVVVLADASERIASLTGARGDERAAPSFDRAGFGAMLVRRALARGPRFETWLADQLAPAATPPHGVASAVESLTAREREILGLLVDGLTNKEIAQRLVVSPRTAETHVASVFGKLGVNSRARAIAKALADGYVVRT